jgi:plastocyanin
MKYVKYIAAISIVALLGAGCAKAPASNTNANVPAVGTTPSKPASDSFTVTIASDGEFSPVTAYVKKGTAVTFKNTTDKVHHIIPSYDIPTKLSDLDSGTDLAPGASFTYTFSKVGRWLYEDSKHQGFGGAVEVSQ